MANPYPKPQKQRHAGIWIPAGILLTLICTGVAAVIGLRTTYGPNDLPILAGTVTFDLVFVGGLVYLLPSIIAFQRQLQQRRSLLLINIVLGITVIGWVGCLVWSLTG